MNGNGVVLCGHVPSLEELREREERQKAAQRAAANLELSHLFALEWSRLNGDSPVYRRRALARLAVKFWVRAKEAA